MEFTVKFILIGLILLSTYSLADTNYEYPLLNKYEYLIEWENSGSGEKEVIRFETVNSTDLYIEKSMIYFGGKGVFIGSGLMGIFDVRYSFSCKTQDFEFLSGEYGGLYKGEMTSKDKSKSQEVKEVIKMISDGPSKNLKTSLQLFCQNVLSNREVNPILELKKYLLANHYLNFDHLLETPKKSLSAILFYFNPDYLFEWDNENNVINKPITDYFVRNACGVDQECTENMNKTLFISQLGVCGLYDKGHYMLPEICRFDLVLD